jgi:predicted AAA+ superfamily ATPase
LQSYKIYVGRIDDKEIDFVIEKNGNKKYIQSVYLLSDKKVIEREFSGLEEIHDAYEKIVVSLDNVCLGNKNGIKHIRAWDMLANNEI